MAEQSGTAEQVIALPKGGGAVRGLGEKFAPDLHTGTGTFSLPIEVPTGRLGFQPSLSLTYSSGSGNGPFGLGWSLSVPGVTRQTSRGLPTYADAEDTFVLSGAEDLVAVGTVDGVTRYRPRTEGLFARIEHHVGPLNDFWRVRTPNGHTSLYGTPRPDGVDDDWRDPATLADPADPRRIFAWKLSRTTDQFGNVIVYEYESDEPGRTSGSDDGTSPWVQTYLRRIRYVDHPGAEGGFVVTVVLEYEDRLDELSDRRPAFEVRTRRRCRQIEVHSNAVPDTLIRSQRLHYTTATHNGCSLLRGVEVVGHAGNATQSLPTLDFRYTEFDPTARTFAPVTGDLPAASLAQPGLELVDLDGDGLPDLLETTGAMRSWRNLGNGSFAPPRPMSSAPAGVSLGDPGVSLLDADGDGRIDLMVTTGGLAGYFPIGASGEWDRRVFQPYDVAPSFSIDDPDVRLVDLDGDGVIDALRTGSRFECFFNDPRAGWHATRVVDRGRYPEFPDVSFSDPRVRLADMTGDGLQDIVVVHDGRVEYWPSLGRGDWSHRREMRESPRFPHGYDPRRILLGDVDGDGVADLVYVDTDSVTLWINQCGRQWSTPTRIKGTPRVTDTSSLRLVDLLGHGVSGLLWSTTDAPTDTAQWAFLDFTGASKPGLLTRMDNGLGSVTDVEYVPSTRFLLADERDPATRWTTTLPFPVQVVASVRVADLVAGSTLTTEYSYHDGHWDGAEREFRGFGRVDQRDMVRAGDRGPGVDPLETRTWFHQGPIGPALGAWREYEPRADHWAPDPPGWSRPQAVTDLLDSLPRRARRDAVRALRGSVLRTELYELDGSEREHRPVTVTEVLTGVREEAAPTPDEADRRRVFFPHQLATRTTHWDRGDDPMTRLAFSERHDAYGQPCSQTEIAVPARTGSSIARSR